MMQIKNERLRKVLKIVVPFIAVPGVVIVSSLISREKSYSFAALVIVLLSMLLFISGFEKKSTGTRRLVITAVMTALAVTGRIIFSAIPGFAPITAFAVITGIYLGGEAGFMVGTLSAVISNFYAGQGVWTPFQMFAWGMLGLIAGLLSKKLRKSKISLYVYGTFAGVAYSLLMDIWTVVWYNNSFDIKLYLTAIATALPYTITYAASNVIFLLLIAKPFGEKLERIKIKYGV